MSRFRIPAQGYAPAPTALTPATMTVDGPARSPCVQQFSWTNAMVVAAAGTSNKIDVCTLPPKTIVHSAYVVVTTAAGQAATLTVQVGPSDDTDGYIVASNAKAAANTVYGDGDAEIGDDLFDSADDHYLNPLKSYTATTSIQAEFVIGAGTLADVTTSTGKVVILYTVLP